jgi:hypothetical protein
MNDRKNRLLAISDLGFNRLRWSLSVLSTAMATLMVVVLESNY